MTTEKKDTFLDYINMKYPPGIESLGSIDNIENIENIYSVSKEFSSVNEFISFYDKNNKYKQRRFIKNKKDLNNSTFFRISDFEEMSIYLNIKKHNKNIISKIPDLFCNLINTLLNKNTVINYIFVPSNFIYKIIRNNCSLEDVKKILINSFSIFYLFASRHTISSSQSLKDVLKACVLLGLENVQYNESDNTSSTKKIIDKVVEKVFALYNGEEYEEDEDDDDECYEDEDYEIIMKKVNYDTEQIVYICNIADEIKKRVPEYHYLSNPSHYNNKKNNNNFLNICLILYLSPLFQNYTLFEKLSICRYFIDNSYINKNLINSIYVINKTVISKYKNKFTNFVNKKLEKINDNLVLTEYISENEYYSDEDYEDEDYEECKAKTDKLSVYDIKPNIQTKKSVFKYLAKNSIFLPSLLGDINMGNKLGNGSFGSVYNVKGVKKLVAKVSDNNEYTQREIVCNTILANYGYSGICNFYFSFLAGNKVVSVFEKMKYTLNETIRTMNEYEIEYCIFQILTTLYELQENFEFTHYDLHTCNVMLNTTRNTEHYHKFGEKTYKFDSKYNSKIIDLGMCHMKYKNRVYHEEYCEDIGNIYNPGYDCVMFSNELKNYKLKSNVIKRFNEYIDDYEIELEGCRVKDIENPTNICLFDMIEYIFENKMID